ncbi:MAG TPA: hypothetical protein VNX67_09385 [Solirubrobacteraceae bacterium]|nr:hypothetical protein [Solirubrobacteraceae bacterium]
MTATLALFFALSGGALAASHYLINSTRQINPKVLKALRGDVGTPGAAGQRGPAGQIGPSGPQGQEGPKGSEGQRGEKGEPGSASFEGKEGKEGKEGAQGVKGETGPEGKPGVEGKQGPEGKAGLEGKLGPEGKQGPEGKEGKQGKEGPAAKLTAIITVVGEPVTVQPKEEGESRAKCAKGSQAISGGYTIEGEKATTPSPTNQASEAFAEGLEERRGWSISVANPSATETTTIDAIAYCAAEGEAVSGARVAAPLRGSAVTTHSRRHGRRSH